MTKTILVTGHKGFIGKYVYEHFAEKYNVIGLDLKDGEDIRYCTLPDCDIIIHLAGVAGVRNSHLDPNFYWDVNVEGSKRIFNHAKYCGAFLMYASSSSAKNWYTSPYATTKKVIESLAPSYSVGMRFHTVYGIDSRPDMMYRKLLDNTATYITHHTRDFTSVKDVVSAIDILSNGSYNGVIDIGTGTEVQVADLALAIGRSLPYKIVDGEQESSKANTSRLISLGWKPKYLVLDEIKNDLLQKNKMEKLSING